MKKTLAFLCTLVMMLSSITVFAEESTAVYNQLFQVYDGYIESYDSYSETPDTMNIAFTSDEYGMITGFTITVDGVSIEKQCENLSGNVYAIKLSGNFPVWGTLFMVEDEGMDDYSYSYCFLASYGSVYDLGWIPGRPTDILINSNGIFTTHDRSYLLGTWNYACDYIIAHGGHYDDATENYIQTVMLARVPSDDYVIGEIATLNVDLPVLATIEDTQYSATITGGQDVILLNTDMKSRVYITTLDGSVGGWVWIDPSEYPTKVAVNGEYQTEETVFSDLPYAG